MSEPGWPRLLGALLRWVLPAARRDEALGDLTEVHAARVARLGWTRAHRLLWKDFCGLLAWRARLARAPDLGGRDSRGWEGTMMAHDFLQDVRFGLRALKRRPGFTLIVVGVLGLGIGAPTTVLSLVNRIFFVRPVGVEEPHRLVSVHRAWGPDRGGGAFQNADYRYYRDGASTLSGLAAFSGSGEAASYTLDGRSSDQLALEAVSDNYFDVLGARPALGRTFRPDENATPGTHPVVVLSHDFWERALGGDHDAVGRPITINGTAFAVVGVMPEGFRGLDVSSNRADVWAPIAMRGVLSRDEPDASKAWWQREPGNVSTWLRVVGRLAPGVTFEAAEANLLALSGALEWDERDEGETLWVRRQFLYSPDQADMLRTLSTILLGVVALVLLVAAANVAVLLLARASARAREIGIRTAIGAGRGRLVRQLLAESLVLGVLGAALGLLIAFASADFAASLIPVSIEASFAPDLRVAALTIGVGLATALVVGLAPALDAARRDPRTAMTGESERSGRSRAKGALVIGQLALSVVLVAGALLFARSFAAAKAQDLGFEYEDRLVVRANLRAIGYDEARGRTFWRQALEEVNAVPGVVSATLSELVPFRGQWTSSFEAPPDATPNDGDNVRTGVNQVWPGYFRTMGMEIVAGRAFDERDVEGSPPVIVVNEQLAREVWPGESPLGKTLPLRSDMSLEVVGVARDATYYDLGEEPHTQTWRALSQLYSPAANLIVETSVPAASLADAVTNRLRELEPQLAFSTVTTLEAVVEDQAARYEVTAVLVGIFGVLALVLASAGLYGVVSFLVSQRTREIGVRMALGAGEGRVACEVLGSAVRLALAGLVLGLGGAVVARRFTEGFLFGVEASDPVPLVGAVAVLLLVTACAAFFPARRAAGVDPMEAIRAE